jgi:hypothetical protein
MTNRDRQLVQQLVIITTPTIIHDNTSLPTYVPKGFVHQPPDGRQHEDSHGRSSLRRDPLKGPPFNPSFGSFGWPTCDPCTFIPSWYQPLIIQLVPKPATKLPYRKLQYPTYVKDTDPDAHMKVFKRAIKANGETVEVDIINLFGFTLKDGVSEWGENIVQNHPNYIFKELEQAFHK